MKRRVSRCRAASSGALSSAEGCTVASALGASAVRSRWPRSRVTRKALPNSAWRRGGAQRHDDPRRDRTDFGFEPWKACRDLQGAGFAVETPGPARDPLEMLDGVGHPNPRPVDPGLGETAVEQLSGGSDKRMAGLILGVARLLADQHDRRVRRTLAEHRLGGVAVERAERCTVPLWRATRQPAHPPGSSRGHCRFHADGARRASSQRIIPGQHPGTVLAPTSNTAISTGPRKPLNPRCRSWQSAGAAAKARPPCRWR